MVTLRAHRHFTKQARALRVPELCDDHTPPSCLVTNSLAEPRCRSVNTLVLPDPLLTQGGPVTFQACALHQLFVRSCDLAHRGLCCSRVCVCTHRSSLQHSLFPRVHLDEPQYVRLPLGTTGWYHSYYTGIPLSAPHCLQQLQAGASSPSPVQISASTRVSHGAATSSSVSCPQVTHSTFSPQVQTGPTRTVTSDLLSATLAEAATQLSFAAFLERCIFVHASPPPQLPVPTPSLDAATPTIPHIAVSQDVSTQLSLEEFSLRCVHPHNPSRAMAPPSTHDVLRSVPDPSPCYFLTRLCRRLCTAWHLTMPPHNNLSRSFLSVASSPMNLQTAKARHRHIVMPTAPHRLNLRSLLRFVAPAAPATPATVTRTLRPHARHHTLHRVSRRMPASAPHMVYL